MGKIEDTHKKNFELIKEYDLKKGTILKLKEDFKYFHTGDLFTISRIHAIYGWILFEETEQLPQDAERLVNLCEVAKKEMILRNL